MPDATSGGEMDSKSGDSQKPHYYQEEIGDNLTDGMRKILLEYSGVPEDELEQHLYTVRAKAWAASPYPCVGDWTFLRLHAREHAAYRDIVARARAAPPGDFLVCDVGAGLGQELRCLAADGVPAASLRALDLDDGLWECGLELFRDRERMRAAAFARGSVLDLRQGDAGAWRGSLDVMIAGLMLHCFGRDGQQVAAENLAALARKKAGSTVLGWQLGGNAEHVRSPSGDRELFLHDESSFKEMWRMVGEKTGETWTASVKTAPLPRHVIESQGWMPPQTTLLWFSVVRG